ncbi:MAG: hypothetical protein HY855_26510 [Burkholderiales bacterium]|nr:hypothetical protein [Burkholderiales bacterium]
MNGYLAAAGGLALIVGAVHSWLGERLIFRRLRRHSFVPTEGAPLLREPQVRILWATWHVATALGWGIGGALLWLSQPSPGLPLHPAALLALAAGMVASAALVLVGTRGQHPGWAGLLGVGVLVALGAWA